VVENLAENDKALVAQGCTNYTPLSEHGRRAAHASCFSDARETTLEFVRVVYTIHDASSAIINDPILNDPIP
jgi:hypothetical protein